MQSLALLKHLIGAVIFVFGFAGPPCVKRKAPCDPNPCRNGGACKESRKGFVCRCPERFAGLYCESRVDFDCTSHDLKLS
uniref:EGF-like domain-containing protein n=1 Tax=Amphilophus citrinellus TaxID=61819 RepID=A0A3Q0ST54_AMPCI